MIKKIISSLTALSLLLLGGCEEDATTYSNTNPIAEYGVQVSFSLSDAAPVWSAGDAVGITMAGDDYSQNRKWIVDTDLTSLYPNTEQSKIYIESESIAQEAEFFAYYPYSTTNSETSLVQLYVESQEQIWRGGVSSTTNAAPAFELTEQLAQVDFNFTMKEGQGALPTNLIASISNIYTSAGYDPVNSTFSGTVGEWEDVEVKSGKLAALLFPQEELDEISMSMVSDLGVRYIATVTTDLSEVSWLSGESYVCDVLVEREPSAVTQVSLAASTYGVIVAENIEITATLVEGTLFDTIEWVSSDTTKATVAWSAENPLYCTITGQGAGDVEISLNMTSTDSESGATNVIKESVTITVFESQVFVKTITIAVVGEESYASSDYSTILDTDTSIYLKATIAPTTATDPSCTWRVASGAEYVDLDPATGLVTGVAAGEAVIEVSANGVEAGDSVVATCTITVIEKGAPIAGYYYYANNKNSARFTYSEASASEKAKYEGYGYSVKGVIYNVDSSTHKAKAMHVDSPYGYYAWATSGTTYASTMVPSTSNSCGRTNMNAVKSVDSTFATLPLFKYVDGLNGTVGTTSYDSTTENVWYLPANTELVTLCTWLYSIGGSDISVLNDMLSDAGGNTTKQFLTFSATGINNMRIWSSYDSGSTNASGVSTITIYCPSGKNNGYATTTQIKTNSTQGVPTPILEFSFPE